MSKVKRLGVLSVANISGILYAIFGLIAGLFAAFFSTLAASFGGYDSFGIFGMGFAGIIVLPIMYGVIGWIGGLISAALYNLVARWTGGIQVELEQ